VLRPRMHLPLTFPRRQRLDGHARFDESLEPRVRDAATGLAGVEQTERHPGSRLSRTMETLGSEPQPVQAVARTFDEVVDDSDREVGVVEPADIDRRPRSARARNPIHDHEVVGLQGPDPVLYDVEAADPSTRCTPITSIGGGRWQPSIPWRWAAARDPAWKPDPTNVATIIRWCQVIGAPRMRSTPRTGSSTRPARAMVWIRREESPRVTAWSREKAPCREAASSATAPMASLHCIDPVLPGRRAPSTHVRSGRPNRADPCGQSASLRDLPTLGAGSGPNRLDFAIGADRSRRCEPTWARTVGTSALVGTRRASRGRLTVLAGPR